MIGRTVPRLNGALLLLVLAVLAAWGQSVFRPSAPGGGAGLSVTFVDNETPQLVQTLQYRLVEPPKPAGSLQLYVNGVRMRPTTDYALSGRYITFNAFHAATLADPDLVLVADYRY